MRWTVPVSLLMISTGAVAAQRAGSSLQIEKDIVDCAGAESKSASFTLLPAVGQSAVGRARSASFETSAGFLEVRDTNPFGVESWGNGGAAAVGDAAATGCTPAPSAGWPPPLIALLVVVVFLRRRLSCAPEKPHLGDGDARQE